MIFSDSLQRCQYRLGTCRRHPDGARKSPRLSEHLQETLRQSATVTVYALAGDSQTVSEVTQTVGAPAGDSQTEPDSLPGRLGICRRLPYSLRRSQYRLDTCRRLPDKSRPSPRPSRHQQETPRQSVTERRPSVHLQGTPRRCHTVSKTIWAPAGDSQTETIWAPAGDSQTLCDPAKTVWAPKGNSQTVPGSLPDYRGTCSRRRNSLRRYL
ncbi:hypothetical protein DPMN_097242 [Dreissena polymorpha]|uniref:Uncharacterized protein n=1 Tax=Dreissena polymorpha TaxID=45954 RepID=A0A9D4LBD3_DREPO|nr:hypothetical protein DPMN_097242 [Dreissena polymorpha]